MSGPGERQHELKMAHSKIRRDRTALVVITAERPSKQFRTEWQDIPVLLKWMK
jgi:hypothetical protein